MKGSFELEKSERRGDYKETISKMLTLWFLYFGLTTFSPLTLQFWTLRKKLQNRPLSFANNFGPNGKNKIKKITRITSPHVSVDRVKIGLWPKTVTCAKLRGRFCSFFLRGSKSQL